MDDIDRAQEQAEKILAASIAAVRNETLPAIGECHNCGEPLVPFARFCDIDCRDDYQRRCQASRRNGVGQ